MPLVDIVEDYLVGWVILAVALGAAVPELAVVTRLSTPILAVMVGGVSLTLTTASFRRVDRAGLLALLAAHLAMPLLAFALARAAGLDGPLLVGFILLGAVTPELVTPVMTALAGGDTALSSTALVVAGVGSTVVVPVAVTLLAGTEVAFSPLAVVRGLVTAVVVPMAVGVGLRARFPDRVAPHEDAYTAVSATMVVVIVGGVTAANAGLVRANAALLAPVAAAALGLNLGGYALGWGVTWFGDRPTRVAACLSVGMRDFAVAAALVVSAGFPPAAALPAVVFGVLELVSSAVLARYFG